MTKPENIQLLAINHGENCGSLYRLKRGTTLHIVPGASLLGRRIVLHCNYPNGAAKFDRKVYYKQQWFQKNGQKLDNGGGGFVEVTSLDIYCELEVNQSGTFRFFFEYEGGLVNKINLNSYLIT